jgi:hypothetical protein
MLIKSSKEAHIAFYPEAAEKLIKKAIDKADELETNLWQEYYTAELVYLPETAYRQ